tara:strand:- start:880 stop:1134 length:255 start_codon:yes stop_codon:yes gene_type:complete
MKLNLYLAAANNYRSRAQEALTALEIIFNNPQAMSSDMDYVDNIKKWTAILVECERSIEVLHKYFGTQAEAAQKAVQRKTDDSK